MIALVPYEREWRQAIMQEKLVFLDLETTGTHPLADRITEIGIVTVQGEQVERWSTLVNPEKSIPPFIQSLTGITDAMVQAAPSFEEVADQLLTRLQSGLLIAHNARFDYGFLRNACKRSGRSLHCQVLCTVKLSRRLFPREAHHNLDALVARHGVVLDERHRALADAEALRQLWNTWRQLTPPEQFAQAVALQLQRPSLPSHLHPDEIDDIPDTPGVYLFFGDSQIPLYIGKSVRLRQRVLSHFNSDHKLYTDMRISQQVQRIEWRPTAGAIGALLLEARLIHDLQPIHNKVMRRQRELCAWQLRDGGGHLRPFLTYASEQDFGSAQALYGLFSSRRKAEEALRELTQHHLLCLATLGLEKTGPGKPCFARQLRRCHGACVDASERRAHAERLQAALDSLRVQAWPFAGAVLLSESGEGDASDLHLVNNWSHLGTVSLSGDKVQDAQQMRRLLKDAPERPAFDLGTYKILTRALARRQLNPRPLSAWQELIAA
jgi:DNA polymerase III subunit epsilon